MSTAKIKLMKTGEIARHLCVTYTDVMHAIDRLGIQADMCVDCVDRYDFDAVSPRIIAELAKPSRRGGRKLATVGAAHA
jgi:hypothetical protein